MKLREFMETHDGQYIVPETVHKVTVRNLDDEWAQDEVEPYVVGHDPAGRCKVFLYSERRHRHLLTYVSEPELEKP